jgi:hypothetical protein
MLPSSGDSLTISGDNYGKTISKKNIIPKLRLQGSEWCIFIEILKK